MNNKGFTLIELLASIAIMSVIVLTFIIVVNNSFGMTDEKSYEIMKNNIVTQVNQYILECDNGIINCNNDYSWVSNNSDYLSASFYLGVMKGYGYFREDEFINPVTEMDISNCLLINVIKDKYSNISVKLDDSACLK